MAIRTTFLVGFPGEDDSAFDNLCDFVREAQFDRLGVFEYSPEEGTPGYAMTPRVPKRVAAKRRHALMALQQPISLAVNERLIGSEMDVLLESSRADGIFVARSWRDAPEIDGSVLVTGATGAAPGDWARVRITSAQPYDLEADTISLSNLPL